MNNIFQPIEPATRLEITETDYTDGTIKLTAPLPPNQNDKGTAFAGSISSLLVLAGWGVLTRRLQAEGIEANIMVTESQTRYRRPVRDQLVATATLDDITPLLHQLETKQRGRMEVTTHLHSNHKCCASMTAQFAIFPKNPA